MVWGGINARKVFWLTFGIVLVCVILGASVRVFRAVFWLDALLISGIGATTALFCLLWRKRLPEWPTNEQALAAIVAASPLPIVVFDHAGKVHTWSPAAENVFGWLASEVVGYTCPAIPGSEQQEFCEILAKALQGNTLNGVETVRCTKDGSLLQVVIDAAPTMNKHGYISGMVSVISNVTEQKRAQELLQRYRLLSENVHDIVLYIDGNGHIVEANKAAERVYGYTALEFRQLKVHDLQASPVSPEQQVFAPGSVGSGISFETYHRRKDGSVFPAEVSATGMDINGTPLLLGIVRDISVRKRQEAALHMLHTIDQMILSNNPPQSILDTVCRALVQEMHYDLAYISIKEPDGTLPVKVKAGLAKAFLSQVEIRWDDSPEGVGPTGTAVKTGEACVVMMAANEVYKPISRAAKHFGIVKLGAVPLVIEGETLGALTLGTVREEDLTSEDVSVLVTFAGQMALSMLAARRHEVQQLQTAILNSVANAVMVTNTEGIITWVNPAFTELTGYTLSEALGSQPQDLLSTGVNDAEFYRTLWHTLQEGRVWRGEITNRRKNGTLYEEEMTVTPVLDDAGVTLYYVAIKQDITARKQQEQQLYHLAMHDPLTNLLNRKALQERLQAMVATAQNGAHGVLMLIDLDDFKFVNDTLGHASGDELLVLVARHLTSVLQPADPLVRLGGDEFAALLYNCSIEQALLVADSMRTELDSVHIGPSGSSYTPTVSVGVVPVNGELVYEEVLTLADLALYEAKEQGKNRAVAYRQPVDGSHLTQTGQWVGRLRDALRNGGFTLYFQPIVYLSNQQYDYYEALIRLVDGDSVVTPGSFLHIAERFGLAPRIDRWVVQTVLDFLRRTDNVRVSVNLSGCSLSDETLLEHIEAEVIQAELEPGRLTFEVTESAVIHDLSRVRNWMTRLQELGCHFALDDFGKGFSTFSYLRALPTDYVKIDASLITNLAMDNSDRALVNAISTVAHSLGRKVVVEGIEDEALIPLLVELGVEYGQGYSLGRPQPFPVDQALFPHQIHSAV